MRIRQATPGDAAALLEIYGYYVAETATTFEYNVPTPTEFRERITETQKKYPYFVLEDNGKIQGYAYAGAFIGREAYCHSCELSVYIDRDARGRGYGSALYEALETELRHRGILNLYACIADPIGEDPYLTRDSENFHRHLGFETVGRFHKCGYKFSRWYNMIWMEKYLGKHE